MADKDESALTAGEKQCVVGLGFCGPGAGSNTSVADVKDGVHANADDITWTREAPTCKVKAWDGYLYEPLWIHRQDAIARGIVDGEILKIYNERGAVLAGAYVSERVMPGAVSIDHGARYDPIVPGEFDRGGAINTITPHNRTSKNATGMVCSSFLVQVEKVTVAQMNEWKEKYPEAFDRPYDPAQGVCLAGWLEEGGSR